MDDSIAKIVDYRRPEERVFVLLPVEPIKRPLVFGSREACALLYGGDFVERLIETTVVV